MICFFMSVLLFIAHLSPCSEFHVSVSSFCCDCFIWKFQETVSESHPIFSWRPGYNILLQLNLKPGHKRLLCFSHVHMEYQVQILSCWQTVRKVSYRWKLVVLYHCSKFYRCKSVLPNVLLIGTFHQYILFAVITSCDIPILLKICI